MVGQVKHLNRVTWDTIKVKLKHKWIIVFNIHLLDLDSSSVQLRLIFRNRLAQVEVSLKEDTETLVEARHQKVF